MTKNDNDKVIIHTITLDQAEMAVRIVEGMTGSPRPVGMSASDALSQLDDGVQEQLQGASQKLAEYFYECMKATIPSTELQKHDASLN